MGRDFLGTLECIRLERSEQRLHFCLWPDLVHQRTAGAAGFQFLAGRGFDFHVQEVVVGQTPAAQRFQRRQGFASKSTRVPAACVQLGDLAHGQVAACALCIGRAVERGVVHQEQHAVLGELGVALEHAVAVVCAQAEGAHGVLWCQLASTAVGHPAG